MMQAFRRCAAGLLALGAAFSAPFAAAQQTPADAAPALWRVSDADSTLWVFGSIHTLPPDLVWRRPELDAAFAKVEIVYFETPGGQDFLEETQILLVQLGMFPDDQRLSDDLSPEGRRLMSEIATELGLYPPSMERMRPWLAFLAIAAAMAEKEGATVDAGVDTVLENQARAEGKELRYLETHESVLTALAALSHETQIALLEATLADYHKSEEQFAEMVAVWLRGDVDRIDAMTRESLGAAPPAVYDLLIVFRNADWVEQLDQFLKGEGDALVVVGAGHMAGEYSLIDELAARGYEVTRF